MDINNEGKLFVISLYEGKAPELVTEYPACFTSSCSLVPVFSSFKMILCCQCMNVITAIQEVQQVSQKTQTPFQNKIDNDIYQ